MKRKRMETVFGMRVRVFVAALVGAEATAACAAYAGTGEGPVILMATDLPDIVQIIYAIWAANAALAILSGVKDRAMLCMALSLAMGGGVLGSSIGIIAICASSLLFVLLARAMTRPEADAYPPEPLPYTRFANAARGGRSA